MVLGAEFFADEAPELIGSGSRDLLDDSWELPGWAAGDSTCEDYGFGAANPLAASSPNDSPFRAPVRRRLNFSGSLPAAAGMPSPGSFGAHHSGNLPSPGDGHGGEWNPASGIYDPAYYSGNLLSPGAGYSAEWSPGSGFEQAYHSDSLLSPGDDLWSSAEWSLGSGGFEPAHLSGSPLAVPLGPGDGYGAEWSLGSAGFEPAYHSGSLLSPGDVFWPSAEWSPGSGGFEQTFQDSYEDFHPQACSTPMPPDYDG
ncbi:Hypothetical protein NTJ_11777 [Nesidiocoris tenuis]|uniref:Uncharacterized protein n=1 Tax=Nesidiocoris tenuis TaxID=355587 RepID=A0ABN7B3H1_9HEMI|nr:Hypothetical protein NTJ_11777 [Nesidiocoris tenuis]